jgi:hypothetical protein
MKIVWISLLLYGLVTAFFAANRTWKKRQNAHSSNSITTSTRTTNSANNLKTQSSETADQTVDQNTHQTIPDRAIASEDAGQSSPNELVPLRSADLDVRPMAAPASIVEQPVPLESEMDVPLAVSLTVSELMHPQTEEVTVPNLIPADSEIREIQQAAEEKPEVADRPSLIAEIAQLEQPHSENILSHVLQSLDHSDSTVRVAAVFELGELAAKHPGQINQDVIDRLNHLSQDADADVRSQAILALSKLGQGIGNS